MTQIPLWLQIKEQYMERHYDEKGYAWVIYNDKRMFEHRYIMMMHLGRRLKKSEVCHHINGIRDDNRISNIQIMTNPEHSRLHANERAPLPIKMYCFRCGKKFYKEGYRARYGKKAYRRHFCSATCRSKFANYVRHGGDIKKYKRKSGLMCFMEDVAKWLRRYTVDVLFVSSILTILPIFDIM